MKKRQTPERNRKAGSLGREIFLDDSQLLLGGADLSRTRRKETKHIEEMDSGRATPSPSSIQWLCVGSGCRLASLPRGSYRNVFLDLS